MRLINGILSWVLLALFFNGVRLSAIPNGLGAWVEVSEISSKNMLSDAEGMPLLAGLTSFDNQNIICEGDPLAFSWLQTLISSLVLNYCDSCLTISKAQWNNVGVIEVNWNAGNCGFTDLGFWTVYSCDGDTLQHCETTIAGLRCAPDSIVVLPEDLTLRDTIWQCNIADCDIENDSILCRQWLVDTLIAHFELCEVFCIEGNSGNFVYRHDFNGRTLIEFRTTCGLIERNFYDCAGHLVFECRAFDFGSMELCDTSTVPDLMSGELLWDCSQPIKGSTSVFDDREMAADVFPTIFNHVLNIRLSQDWVEKMIVTDARGRKTLRTDNLPHQMSINTSDWPPGAYLLTFIGNNQKLIRRAIKIN